MRASHEKLAQKYSAVLSDESDLSDDEKKSGHFQISPSNFNTIGKETVLDASGESSFVAVTELVLRHGNFGSFDEECLGLLTQLEVLSLSNNHFSSLKGFSHLNNLLVLNINFNSIASLEGLHAPKLQQLYVSNNRLVSLAGIRSFPKLEVLCMYRNMITDLENAVSSCRSLTRLKELDLGGNPCSFGPAYRHTVIKGLVRLKQLDGDSISSLDRDLAALYFTEHSVPKFDPLNRPTTAPAAIASTSQLTLQAGIADQQEDRAQDPFSGLGPDLSTKGRVRLLGSSRLNDDPVVLSYLAESALNDVNTSKFQYLDGLKNQQKNAVRPATSCVDTSRSFVGKLRGANTSQLQPTRPEQEKITPPDSPSEGQARRTLGNTKVRKRERVKGVGTVYDVSESADGETTNKMQPNSSVEDELSLPSVQENTLKTAHNFLDPSNPYATIQKLLKLIEVLKAERSQPEDEELTRLKREIDILRMENQNMYALKEENRNLKKENQSLKKKCDELNASHKQMKISTLNTATGDNWADAEENYQKESFLEDHWSSLNVESVGKELSNGPSSARSRSRPQTALEVISEIEDVDNELAELLRANELSLQEIKQTISETQQEFDEFEQSYGLIPPIQAPSKKQKSLAKKGTHSPSILQEESVFQFADEPPSMKSILAQHNGHSHPSGISDKLPSRDPKPYQSSTNELYSSEEELSIEEDFGVQYESPKQELLFAFTGEISKFSGLS